MIIYHIIIYIEIELDNVL